MTIDGFLKDPANLDHLQDIDKASVKAFGESLNALQGLKDKKLVAVIGTGGTLSMKVEDGIRTPDLDFEGIFAHTNSHLDDFFHAEGLDAFKLDSSQMDYGHVRDLAIVITYIWHEIKVPFMGFLVLHGTDTMAYSAAMMSLMMGQGLPFSIVYMGAQKSIQEPMNDAATNLRNALFTLDALHKQNMAEVVLVMGEKAMLGTSAVKINDTLANAFDAPLHKYVTTFSSLEYPIRLAQWLRKKRDIKFSPTIWNKNYSHTLVVNSYLGLCPDVVSRQVSDEDIKAVLFFSYGAGTVYDGVTDAILEQAKERDIAVFVVSPVNTEYKIVYQSAQDMIEKGVIPLYMTLPTALAKVEIALRMHPGDVEGISRFMNSNYVGEIPDDVSRFSPVLER